MSERIMVRNGPGRRRLRSRTRIPSRGRSPMLLRGDGEELLELGGQHGIPGDPQLALEVELHPDLRVAEHGLEVLVRHLDGALGLAGVALLAGRRVRDEVDGPLAAAV